MIVLERHSVSLSASILSTCKIGLKVNNGFSTSPRKTPSRMDVSPKNTWPNGHFPENPFSKMDTCQNVHLAEWTLPGKPIFQNGHLPECTFGRMDIFPKVHFPEWTLTRMYIWPNGDFISRILRINNIGTLINYVVFFRFLFVFLFFF